jgi:hypothetical protein
LDLEVKSKDGCVLTIGYIWIPQSFVSYHINRGSDPGRELVPHIFDKFLMRSDQFPKENRELVLDQPYPAQARFYSRHTILCKPSWAIFPEALQFAQFSPNFILFAST